MYTHMCVSFSLYTYIYIYICIYVYAMASSVRQDLAGTIAEKLRQLSRLYTYIYT